MTGGKESVGRTSRPRRLAARAACLVLAACIAPSLPAADAIDGSADNTGLAALINAFRAAPGACGGKPAQAAAPLAIQPALSKTPLTPKTYLPQALERLGYPVERAEGIYVSGPQDAESALGAIRNAYCASLLSTQYSSIGVARSGNDWLIVLAQPQRVPQLPDWTEAGQDILRLTNAARAVAHTCGDRAFPPAPPLSWRSTLGEAALRHSRDMAARRSLQHQGSDGSDPGSRALDAGYRWRRVGENIASGQFTPEEAVSGWLSSPPHCANLMDPRLTEMGAAYALQAGSRVVYWTQLFGAPQ
ncbi:CAP domain-containing protein [Noviherbaspirillum galbum]|uniref:CAP domain-containing protein n=1 Tax=Noviherbaspirillum galbum TaxID=2709383 RepID=A0A6B3SUL1_9BURK|nr:CAP domain-containing protein [Noviherbaspirillum galbum]NEX64168.1 CAP domain-containing protein [Noviherbaspirillum galbum]